MGNRVTKRDTIPAVREGGLIPVAEAIKRNLEVGLGRRGDPLDRWVSMRELIDSGLVKKVSVNPTDPGRVSIGVSTSPSDAVVPPVPTGFQTTGGFSAITLTWDNPHTVYGNHAYTQIWRSLIDDIGQASYIGTTNSFMFTDLVGDSDAAYYYWIRLVSEQNRVGPYNAIAGTLGRTTINPDYVMGLIISVEWQSSTGYFAGQVIYPSIDIVRNDVTLHFQVTVAGQSGTVEPTWSSVTQAGDQVSDGGITWTAIDAGRAPFIASNIGGVPVLLLRGAVIENAKITEEKIADAAITEEKISSLSVVNEKIGDSAVDSLKLANDSVITVKIADANVTTEKIAEASITTPLINDAAITTVKIGDAQVSTPKVAGNAITIPVSTYTSGVIDCGGGSYVTAASASINSSGAPIHILISVIIEARWTGDVVNIIDGDENIDVLAKVLRNGTTEVWEEQLVCRPTTIVNNPCCLSISFADQPGTGTQTYTLQISADSDVDVCDVYRRSAVLLETKK